MTARAGVDSVIIGSSAGAAAIQRPSVTSYLGGSYAATSALPNAVITFSDGAIGYFNGSDVLPIGASTTTWNSGSGTKEYGQLFKLPFPVRVYGIWGIVDPDNDFDMVLYSDPLGTPVAERTVAVDANTVQTSTPRRFNVCFSSPYATTSGQNIGAVFKPGASSISAYSKFLASATHRVTDPWGTDGYGISRASGAFANTNSSLEHFYVGLIVGAFDAGGGAAGGISRARAAAGF
jgi:hypothetical protein